MAENNDIALARMAANAISQPLVRHIHTADPSAHVFNGHIYIYPSHDIDSGVPADDIGSHYAMEDYHVFRQETPTAPAVDCGVALHVKDVPWAAKQLWAPDVAFKDGRYYLYFPAKRADGIFQIGVGIGEQPEGPFKAEPRAIEGSYSIDPAVLADDGAYYMVFGGIWGGQLQKYRDNRHAEANVEPAAGEPALGPRIARLGADMKQFAESPRELLILDDRGQPLLAGDHARRYFEGPWMHKYRGRYYLSWSTGNTHLLCHAIGESPYGPFHFAGAFLSPVIGWTTHHSIVEFNGKWWLYYHDAMLSGGTSHLRNIKVTELHYDVNGRILPLHPYGS